MSLDDFKEDNVNEDDAYEGDEAFMKDEFDGVAIEHQETFDDPDKQAETVVLEDDINELAKKPYSEESAE